LMHPLRASLRPCPDPSSLLPDCRRAFSFFRRTTIVLVYLSTALRDQDDHHSCFPCALAQNPILCFWVLPLVTREILSIFLLNVKLTVFLCSAGGIKNGNAGYSVGRKESQHGKLAAIVINLALGVSMLSWLIPCIYALHSTWIDARQDEWNLRSIPFADLLGVFTASKTTTTPLPARLHHWHQRQRRKGRSIASEPLLREHETSVEDRDVEDMEFFRRPWCDVCENRRGDSTYHCDSLGGSTP
jgi:hypothetical protein